MKQALAILEDRLKPIENIFFTWLIRVAVAATLVGSAWIDDAPPLELAAMLIAVYVALRVLMQSGEFYRAAPFDHRVLRGLVTIVLLGLLGLAFIAIEIFAATLSIAAVDN